MKGSLLADQVKVGSFHCNGLFFFTEDLDAPDGAGFGFMDAQYARVLVETGIVGLLCFVWLLWSVIRAARAVHRTAVDPFDRGLAMGFIAGIFGLLAHAIGSNTFIVIRIMEPFWLLTGLVAASQTLQEGEA